MCDIDDYFSNLYLWSCLLFWICCLTVCFVSPHFVPFIRIVSSIISIVCPRCRKLFLVRQFKPLVINCQNDIYVWSFVEKNTPKFRFTWFYYFLLVTINTGNMHQHNQSSLCWVLHDNIYTIIKHYYTRPPQYNAAPYNTTNPTPLFSMAESRKNSSKQVYPQKFLVAFS